MGSLASPQLPHLPTSHHHNNQHQQHLSNHQVVVPLATKIHLATANTAAPVSPQQQAQESSERVNASTTEINKLTSNATTIATDTTNVESVVSRTSPGGGSSLLITHDVGDENGGSSTDVMSLLRAWQLEEVTSNTNINKSAVANNIRNNPVTNTNTGNAARVPSEPSVTTTSVAVDPYDNCLIKPQQQPQQQPVSTTTTTPTTHHQLLSTYVDKETSMLSRLLHDVYVYERKQQDLALSLIDALGSVKRTLEDELMNSGMGLQNIDLGSIQQLLSTARRFGRNCSTNTCSQDEQLLQQQLTTLLNALTQRRRLLENLLLSNVVNPLCGIGSCVSLEHLKLIQTYALGKLGLSSVSSNGLLKNNASSCSLLGGSSSTTNGTLSSPSTGSLGNSTYRGTRFYFEMELSGCSIGRIIIETRPDVAPRMCENFKALVTGERGFGFVGCTVFQCWRGESVITGDFEHNNGRGGHSIYESGLFMPEDTRLPSTRGAIGMRRTQKRHDSKGLVGSQFRVILQDMPGFTGIFGRVVEGIELIDKISEIGDPSGNPTKRVVIRKCGAL